jgi:PTS system galactitol-specific IIB component
MKTKVVLVACGTAVATSTVVAMAIEDAMKEKGIPVSIRQCKATEVPGLVPEVDVIVSTTPIPDNLGKPVIKGLPFLTGIGKDAALAEIEAALHA